MDPISLIAASMQADMQRMQAISQNIANVSTAGYKREVAVPGTTGAVLRDHRPGTLRATGNPLDFAIEGEGYFEVAGETGPAYTRQGAFHIDGNGRLVTAQGYPVLGAAGELSLTGASVTVDPSGELRQQGRLVGRIQLVRFADHDALAPLGNALFALGQARRDDTGQAGRIRSGFLENSNVNSPQEMVRMTETVRHFESMQKLMQGYQDAFDKALNKLGEF
jgi:flagellar basal-body rod protein FlgF